jgi:hypothetical protein
LARFLDVGDTHPPFWVCVRHRIASFWSPYLPGRGPANDFEVCDSFSQPCLIVVFSVCHQSIPRLEMNPKSMLKLQQKRLISASRIFHRDNFLLDISLQINMHLEKMNSDLSDLFNFQALAVRYSHVKVMQYYCGLIITSFPKNHKLDSCCLTDIARFHYCSTCPNRVNVPKHRLPGLGGGVSIAFKQVFPASGLPQGQVQVQFLWSCNRTCHMVNW